MKGAKGEEVEGKQGPLAQASELGAEERGLLLQAVGAVEGCLVGEGLGQAGAGMETGARGRTAMKRYSNKRRG